MATRVTIEDNKLRCSFGVIESSVHLTAAYDLRVDLQIYRTVIQASSLLVNFPHKKHPLELNSHKITFYNQDLSAT